MEYSSSPQSSAQQDLPTSPLSPDLQHAGVLSSADASYRLLFEKHPQPMWIVEQSTLRFLDVNNAALQSYGYSRAEFLQMTLYDIRPLADAALLKNEVKHSEPLEYTGRWRHRKKNGALFEARIVSLAIEFNGVPARLATVTDITEMEIAELARRQASAIARENLERFRATFEQAAVGIAQSKPGGELLMVNPGLCEMLGYKAEELIGLSIRDITHPDDLELDLPRREALMKGEIKAYTVEKRYRKKNGKALWASVTHSLTHNEEGKLLSVLRIVQDISARKKVEEELALSEERFRLACEAAHLGVFDHDLIAKEYRTSPQAERLFGFEPSGPRPSIRDWTLRIHPDDASHMARAVEQGVYRNEPINVEFRVIWPDGSTHWIATIAHPVWEDGVPTRNIGVMQDISARKKAEEALALSEERYRSFIAHATEGIWRCAIEPPVSIKLPVEEQIAAIFQAAYVAECNDAMARMYGFEKGEEIVGVRLEQIWTPDNPRNMDFLRYVVENNYRAEDQESQELDRDGNPKIFLNNLVGMVEDQKLTHAWGVQRDITEQRRAESALRDEQQRLRLALDAGEMGIWSWDIARDYSVWNERHYQILGLEPNSAPASYRTMEPLILEEDRARIQEEIARILQKQGPSCSESQSRSQDDFQGEFRVVWPDGSIHWLASFGRVTERDARGSALVMSGVIFDIQDLKQAEAELRSAHEQLQLTAAELEKRVEERTQELMTANALLQDEIIQRREIEDARTRLVRRLVSAQEEERRRLSRELHDQMGQNLTAILMGLKTLPAPTAPTADELLRLQKLTGEVMEQVHSMAWELRPAALDNLGIEAALEQYLAEWSHANRTRAELLSRIAPEFRVPSHLEATLYRMVQEALTNVARHAKAQKVDVILECRSEEISVVVEDDGCGFIVGSETTEGLSRLGIVGMRERIELVGGTFQIESAPGKGTTVVARVPTKKRKTGKLSDTRKPLARKKRTR